MRSTVEKLTCGAFTGGVFVFLFGLAVTSMPSQASVTIESPASRQAVYLSLPAPEGAEVAEVAEVKAPAEPVAAKPRTAEPEVGPDLAEAPPRPESTLGVPMPAGRIAPERLPRGTGRAALAAAPSEPAEPVRKGRACVEPTGQIDAIRADVYVVDKGLVDAYAGDLDAASRLAWASWHADAAGETDGFRVRRIRCGSPLHEAGFRNGDVVHAINGKQITTIPAALMAYRRVKRNDSLRVDITRNDGSQRALQYTLR